MVENAPPYFECPPLAPFHPKVSSYHLGMPLVHLNTPCSIFFKSQKEASLGLEVLSIDLLLWFASVCSFTFTDKNLWMSSVRRSGLVFVTFQGWFPSLQSQIYITEPLPQWEMTDVTGGGRLGSKNASSELLSTKVSAWTSGLGCLPLGYLDCESNGFCGLPF